jgi:dienelactone hydrolase
MEEWAVQIPTVSATIGGDLQVPAGASGAVLFAHGSGSGRLSPRNRFVAESLQSAGLATLLIDLLSKQEEAVDRESAALRFDIGLLAQRLEQAIGWLAEQSLTRALPIGLFGASTGAAAALVAASRSGSVRAVVSRGGRPDLARDALLQVHVPVLLIVGSSDDGVVQLNQQAFRMLPGVKRLELVPRATHLFQEPGALDQVAKLAQKWFLEYLPTA